MTEITRTTKETAIRARFNPYGNGHAELRTGIGFFDHMLDALTRHGLFDLELSCEGDLHVDAHHTVEDCGIVLGQAFASAIFPVSGIARFGDASVPMDEALILATVDISGRGSFYGDLSPLPEMIGTFPTELVGEFFGAFTKEARVSLHLVRMRGQNGHHLVEAAFKATALALRRALSPEPRAGIPSTKGTL